MTKPDKNNTIDNVELKNNVSLVNGQTSISNNFGSISLLIIHHCICSVLGHDDIDFSVIAINISLLLDNVSASSNACFSLGL